MNEVDALLSAMERLVVPLRLNDGFSEDAYVELTEALGNCAQAWAGQDCIPRMGANVLVDLMPTLESLSYAYPEPAASRIMNAAFEIHGLVQECVAID